VESNTTHVTAMTGSAAAFLGVRSEWASLVNAGPNYAPTLNSVLVAGLLDARCAAFPAAPAPTMQREPMAAVLPIVNLARKQNNVHKTRIGAGGHGAMGPHPEREPA
jgi:hypothetical protein